MHAKLAKFNVSGVIVSNLYCNVTSRSCFFLFFLIQFISLSSFFTHIEMNQSEGGAKYGVPGEKPPDTPASRTWLVPHVNCALCEAQTHIGEMIK